MARLMTCIVFLLLAGCGTVNQPIEIAAGEQVEGNLRSVNGAMTIGENAQVAGDLTNVNGKIEVGEGARVGSIMNVNGRIILGAGAEAKDTESVNGSVSMGRNVTIQGGISAVNGSIDVAEQSLIQGDIQTVNGRITVGPSARVEGMIANIRGKIELEAAFAQSIETQAGSIDLMADTTIEGKLWVKEAKPGENDVPRIVIGPGVRVGGPLQFDRQVELLVHDDAEVGEIIGAEPKCFSCEITDL